jgi:hypothetical protein
MEGSAVVLGNILSDIIVRGRPSLPSGEAVTEIPITDMKVRLTEEFKIVTLQRLCSFCYMWASGSVSPVKTAWPMIPVWASVLI